MQIRDKDEQIRDKNEQIHDKDEQIYHKDEQICVKDYQLHAKDEQIRHLQDQLHHMEDVRLENPIVDSKHQSHRKDEVQLTDVVVHVLTQFQLLLGVIKFTVARVTLL